MPHHALTPPERASQVFSFFQSDTFGKSLQALRSYHPIRGYHIGDQLASQESCLLPNELEETSREGSALILAIQWPYVRAFPHLQIYKSEADLERLTDLCHNW